MNIQVLATRKLIAVAMVIAVFAPTCYARGGGSGGGHAGSGFAGGGGFHGGVGGGTPVAAGGAGSARAATGGGWPGIGVKAPNTGSRRRGYYGGYGWGMGLGWGGGGYGYGYPYGVDYGDPSGSALDSYNLRQDDRRAKLSGNDTVKNYHPAQVARRSSWDM